MEQSISIIPENTEDYYSEDLPQLGNRGAYLVQQMNDKLVEHKNYIHEVGQDMPEILDWKWHI
mgnify:CR=1 FL=1